MKIKMKICVFPAGLRIKMLMMSIRAGRQENLSDDHDDYFDNQDYHQFNLYLITLTTFRWRRIVVMMMIMIISMIIIKLIILITLTTSRWSFVTARWRGEESELSNVK